MSGGDSCSGDFFVGAVELMLHERFLSSAVRVMDPKQADFFYVPAWQRAAEGLGPKLDSAFVHEGPWVGTVRPEGSLNFFERVVDHIRTTYPYWDRNDGYDHIFVATVRHQLSLSLAGSAASTVCDVAMPGACEAGGPCGSLSNRSHSPSSALKVPRSRLSRRSPRWACATTRSAACCVSARARSRRPSC